MEIFCPLQLLAVTQVKVGLLLCKLMGRGTSGAVRGSAPGCAHAAADGVPAFERPCPACEQPEDASGWS